MNELGRDFIRHNDLIEVEPSAAKQFINLA